MVIIWLKMANTRTLIDFWLTGEYTACVRAQRRGAKRRGAERDDTADLDLKNNFSSGWKKVSAVSACYGATLLNLDQPLTSESLNQLKRLPTKQKNTA